MIDTFEVPNIQKLSSQLKSLGSQKNINTALIKAFAGVGSRTKQSMSGFFSAFTGETKSAVKMTTPSLGSGAGGTFTVLEIGIAAGVLARDKAFFQNYNKQPNTKSIPSPGRAPEFEKWVRAKFAGKYKTERDFRRLYYLVTKSIARSGRTGKWALERAQTNVLMPELDKICSDVLDYIVNQAMSDDSAQKGAY